MEKIKQLEKMEEKQLKRLEGEELNQYIQKISPEISPHLRSRHGLSQEGIDYIVYDRATKTSELAPKVIPEKLKKQGWKLDVLSSDDFEGITETRYFIEKHMGTLPEDEDYSAFMRKVKKAKPGSAHAHDEHRHFMTVKEKEDVIAALEYLEPYPGDSYGRKELITLQHIVTDREHSKKFFKETGFTLGEWLSLQILNELREKGAKQVRFSANPEGEQLMRRLAKRPEVEAVIIPKRTTEDSSFIAFNQDVIRI